MSSYKNLPSERPIFSHNYARTARVVPQSTHNRASTVHARKVRGINTLIPNNTPAIEFDEDSNCLGLSNSPGSTNICTDAMFRRGFSPSTNPTTTWIHLSSNPTVVTTDTPFDNSRAVRLTKQGSSSQIYTMVNRSTGALTVSAYAKAGTSSNIMLNVLATAQSNLNSYPYANFDLVAGTTTNGVSGQVANGAYTDIKSSMFYVGGGWWRCVLSLRIGIASEGSIIRCGIYADALNNLSVADNKTVLITGFQCEARQSHTSFIDTDGAQITRSAEEHTLSNFPINGLEGSIYAEFTVESVTEVDTTIFSINQADARQAYALDVRMTTNPFQITGRKIVNAAQYLTKHDYDPLLLNNNRHIYKVVLSWNLDKIWTVVNGGECLEIDAPGQVMDLTRMRLGTRGDLRNPFYGNYRSIVAYRSPLTPEQMQALTN